LSNLNITKLQHLNSLVLKQTDGHDFFISASNTVIISVPSLAFILKFLIMNGFMSRKVLEGILSETEEYFKDNV
jgi:hypothetical protein